MKKTFYSFVALVAAMMMPSVLMAEEETTIEVQYLVVHQDNGAESRFALKEYPEMTFKGDTMTVTTLERVLSFGLEDVTSYTFATELEPLSIRTIQEDKAVDPEFSYAKAEFTGLKAGTAVRVYGINGQMLLTVKANASGVARIDLSSLPKGVVLLNTSGKSFKIINK